VEMKIDEDERVLEIKITARNQQIPFGDKGGT
jgi:hypothetical protein